jgi:hypothetical protein
MLSELVPDKLIFWNIFLLCNYVHLPFKFDTYLHAYLRYFLQSPPCLFNFGNAIYHLLGEESNAKGVFVKKIFFLVIQNLCMYKTRFGCHVFGGNMYALLVPIFFANGVGTFLFKSLGG